MFGVITYKVLCVACLLGVCTGVLMVDGTFINFRGEEIRRTIEQLDEQPA